MPDDRDALAPVEDVPDAWLWRSLQLRHRSPVLHHLVTIRRSADTHSSPGGGYLGRMGWDAFPRVVDGRTRTAKQVLREELVRSALAVYVNLKSGTAYAAVPGDDGQVHACYFIADTEEFDGETHLRLQATPRRGVALPLARRDRKGHHALVLASAEHPRGNEGTRPWIVKCQVN
jgi:hypothetical protein